MDVYFNYRVTGGPAEAERRAFLSRWRRLARRDKRWVHPYMPTLRWALDPTRNRHLGRMDPYLAYAEAVQRRQNPNSPSGSEPALASVPWEVPVAAAAVLTDPRRADRTGYLGLLQSDNDEQSLDHLLGYLSESRPGHKLKRLIGPSGLSPHLESGLLVDCWDRDPPWHTAYNPPFLPELVARTGQPTERLRLYRLAVPEETLPVAGGQVTTTPFDPQRLTGDLLPLLVAACSTAGSLIAPDQPEAEFMLHWLDLKSLVGMLAFVERKPVGFVLLQPDRSRALSRAGGADNPLHRLYWYWLTNRPSREGRLLFGAVDPAWRGRGIGRSLLDEALLVAQDHGWRELSVGPVVETGAGAAFLASHGARPLQTYQLYEFTI